VALIFWAMIPDLPMPVVTTCPCAGEHELDGPREAGPTSSTWAVDRLGLEAQDLAAVGDVPLVEGSPAMSVDDHVAEARHAHDLDLPHVTSLRFFFTPCLAASMM
jgi:hypothetical protein